MCVCVCDICSVFVCMCVWGGGGQNIINWGGDRWGNITYIHVSKE